MLDGVATQAARGLLAWWARRVDPTRRRWIEAMRRDLDQIDGGWARLMWAAGGLRYAWLASPGGSRRKQEGWLESWRIVSGGLLLGMLAWAAFSTHVPNVEKLPAEMLFGFLGLYFYSAGFLSGRRTGKIGTGTWAGIFCGLAFGAVVCARMVVTALHEGVRESIRSGAPDQVAIAWSGLVFFMALGAACGALGARSAIRARRQGY